MSEMDQGPAPRPCRHCGRVFSRRVELGYHVISFHGRRGFGRHIYERFESEEAYQEALRTSSERLEEFRREEAQSARVSASVPHPQRTSSPSPHLERPMPSTEWPERRSDAPPRRGQRRTRPRSSSRNSTWTRTEAKSPRASASMSDLNTVSNPSPQFERPMPSTEWPERHSNAPPRRSCRGRRDASYRRGSTRTTERVASSVRSTSVSRPDNVPNSSPQLERPMPSTEWPERCPDVPSSRCHRGMRNWTCNSSSPRSAWTGGYINVRAMTVAQDIPDCPSPPLNVLYEDDRDEESTAERSSPEMPVLEPEYPVFPRPRGRNTAATPLSVMQPIVEDERTPPEAEDSDFEILDVARDSDVESLSDERVEELLMSPEPPASSERPVSPSLLVVATLRNPVEDYVVYEIDSSSEDEDVIRLDVTRPRTTVPVTRGLTLDLPGRLREEHLFRALEEWPHLDTHEIAERVVHVCGLGVSDLPVLRSALRWLAMGRREAARAFQEAQNFASTAEGITTAQRTAIISAAVTRELERKIVENVGEEYSRVLFVPEPSAASDA